MMNLMHKINAATLCFFLLSTTANAEKAAAYIIEPANNAIISGPVVVKFGLKGMGVSPAGFEKANTGHHHLLIDLAELPDLSVSIPADKHHVHFGGGQTQTTLTLAPGTHTLQLLLGDHLHRPHDTPVISEKIKITVK